MRRCKRRFGANSSGQLLVVAALSIAIIISSTTIYVYELSKEAKSRDSRSITDFIFALKQATRNAMISSLADVSKGGERAILEDNLNNLSQVFMNLHQFGMCYLSFMVFNDSRYDSGICLSWNTNNSGASSAYTNFTLKLDHMMTDIVVDYAVNVTTTVVISGSYTKLEGEEKLVNLTCQVSDKEEPTLAKKITLFYEDLGSWIPINSSNNLSVADYGNGTYLLSFTISTLSDVQVSAHVHDVREIFVQANATCTEA